MKQSKTLEWEFTDRGTWIAEGYQWGYELIRNYDAINTDGSPREMWNVRVWRLLAHRPESRIIGGYSSVETAQWWAQRDEDNDRAPFKVNWYAHLEDD